MDTELLVESKIEDGEKLIRQLIRDQFEVAVALWIKFSENDLWRLHIGSSSFVSEKPNQAIGLVFAALDKIPECSVLPSEITLLSNMDPIARDAIALRDRYPGREPKRFHAIRLGKIFTVELCIYPKRLPLKVREQPDGSWQVLISEFDDVWLTCESERDARDIAAARVLEAEALTGSKTGPQFAKELDRTADVMEKYRMSFGSRFLRRRAQEVRQ